MKKIILFFLLTIHINCATHKELPNEQYDCSNGVVNYSKTKNLLSRLAKLTEGSCNVRSLNLSGNNLKEIPQDVFLMKDLENLWLDQNNIQKISKKIVELTKLRKLSFDGNRKIKLPDNFHKLNSLELILYFDNDMSVEEKDDFLCKIPTKCEVFFIKELKEKSTYPCNGN